MKKSVKMKYCGLRTNGESVPGLQRETGQNSLTDGRTSEELNGNHALPQVRADIRDAGTT